ncbi:hypothetical protein GCM10027051_22580 [Niabella terrae]
MIIKEQPYYAYDNEIVSKKREYGQIKNIRSRLIRLKLSEIELNSIFKSASILTP